MCEPECDTARLTHTHRRKRTHAQKHSSFSHTHTHRSVTHKKNILTHISEEYLRNMSENRGLKGLGKGECVGVGEGWEGIGGGRQEG